MSLALVWIPCLSPAVEYCWLKESVLYCVVRLALHLFWEPQQTPLHPWRLVWAAKWRLIKSQDCHQHQSESSSVLRNWGDPPPQMAPRQVCPEKWCHCMSDLSLMHESTVDIRLTARDNVFTVQWKNTNHAFEQLLAGTKKVSMLPNNPLTHLHLYPIISFYSLNLSLMNWFTLKKFQKFKSSVLTKWKDPHFQIFTQTQH